MRYLNFCIGLDSPYKLKEDVILVLSELQKNNQHLMITELTKEPILIQAVIDMLLNKEDISFAINAFGNLLYLDNCYGDQFIEFKGLDALCGRIKQTIEPSLLRN